MDVSLLSDSSLRANRNVGSRLFSKSVVEVSAGGDEVAVASELIGLVDEEGQSNPFVSPPSKGSISFLVDRIVLLGGGVVARLIITSTTSFENKVSGLVTREVNGDSEGADEDTVAVAELRRALYSVDGDVCCSLVAEEEVLGEDE